MLGGRQVTVTRPRDAPSRAPRSSWTPGRRSPSRICSTGSTVERMLAGVATRRHVDVAEPLSAELEAKPRRRGVPRSVGGSSGPPRPRLAELLARDLSGLGSGGHHDRRARRRRPVLRGGAGHLH